MAGLVPAGGAVAVLVQHGAMEVDQHRPEGLVPVGERLAGEVNAAAEVCEILKVSSGNSSISRQ